MMIENVFETNSGSVPRYSTPSYGYRDGRYSVTFNILLLTKSKRVARKDFFVWKSIGLLFFDRHRDYCRLFYKDYASDWPQQSSHNKTMIIQPNGVQNINGQIHQ
ncbi:hypothetical protein O9929_13715 [Vibrio lentus]|nr:hypothetical protein [Vibrio lentus]